MLSRITAGLTDVPFGRPHGGILSSGDAGVFKKGTNSPLHTYCLLAKRHRLHGRRALRSCAIMAAMVGLPAGPQVRIHG